MDTFGWRAVLLAVAMMGCYQSYGPVDPGSVPRSQAPGEPELCGDGLDQDGDGDDPPCPVDACAQSPWSTTTETLSFDDPGGCRWDVSPRDGFFRTRSEQVEPLSVPSSAILCSMQIAIDEGQMLFDDELIVTFADTIVAASFDPRDVFETVDGMATYRWNALRDRPMLSVTTEPYCLGTTDECSLPRSEERGRFGLSLGGDTGLRLSERGIAEGRHDFMVVITGDNNEDADCRHTPFGLHVSYSYVVP